MYCPNRECPDLEEMGEPGEYRDDIESCPKCETRLVAERPEFDDGSDVAPAQDDGEEQEAAPAIQTCVECGRALPRGEMVCPDCNREEPEPPPAPKKSGDARPGTRLFLFLLVAGVLVLPAVHLGWLTPPAAAIGAVAVAVIATFLTGGSTDGNSPDRP